MTFDVRYILMTTDQVPPSLIAEWMSEPLFAKWIERKEAERREALRQRDGHGS